MKKDVISKKILSNLIKEIGEIFFNEKIEKVEFLSEELKRVEVRKADIVAKINDSYILHLEIQNSNDKNMPLRMLRYLVDIMQITTLPIKQYVIYIGKSSLNMQNRIKKEKLFFEYDIIDIRNIDCEVMLKKDTPEALVLAILCDFKGKNPKDVIKYILSRLKFYLDSKNFKDYVYMLEELSKNRNLQEEIKEVEKMLTEIDITTLPSWELGLEEGRKKGLEEGRKKGLEEGKREGIKEGIKEGRKKELVKIINKTLLLRFDKSIDEKTLYSKTLNELEEIFEDCLTKSFEEIKRKLDEMV